MQRRLSPGRWWGGQPRKVWYVRFLFGTIISEMRCTSDVTGLLGPAPKLELCSAVLFRCQEHYAHM